MKKWRTEKKRKAERARRNNKNAIPRVCDGCGRKFAITSAEMHSASKPRCPQCGCTRLLRASEASGRTCPTTNELSKSARNARMIRASREERERNHRPAEAPAGQINRPFAPLLPPLALHVRRSVDSQEDTR
jgi:predicted  nucleic acid-binding Zn-ribbon protein